MCDRLFVLPFCLLVERQGIRLCREALSSASPQLNSDDRRRQRQAIELDLQQIKPVLHCPIRLYATQGQARCGCLQMKKTEQHMLHGHLPGQ